MHELAITQSILDIALRHAVKAGGNRITDLYLVIGQLSSIVDDSVAFYWDIISKDSLAEGARLHFRRIPAELLCRDCQRRFSPNEDLACPECRSSRIRVVAGDEFYLESIGVTETSGHPAIPGPS
jgi:hydrogenase nickel incorporation protein HypA/HybF